MVTCRLPFGPRWTKLCPQAWYRCYCSVGRGSFGIWPDHLPGIDAIESNLPLIRRMSTFRLFPGVARHSQSQSS